MTIVKSNGSAINVQGNGQVNVIERLNSPVYAEKNKRVVEVARAALNDNSPNNAIPENAQHHAMLGCGLSFLRTTYNPWLSSEF